MKKVVKRRRITRDELTEKLLAYRKKFGDTFPTAGWSQGADALAEAVDECMRTGKPYKVSWFRAFPFKIHELLEARKS